MPPLLDLSPAEWQALVRQTLEAWREGDLLALAESPLAQSPLVAACFFTGEARTPDAYARALQAVLRWAVERQKPDGPPSWTANAWQTYNWLFYFYGEGLKLTELAEKTSMAEQTSVRVRKNAFATLAALFLSELRHPQATVERQRAYQAGRYARYPEPQRRRLRALAIFRRPIAPALLEQLVADPPPAAPYWADLVAAGWVVSDAEYTTLMAHPEARPHLLAWLTPTERRLWHTEAGAHYVAQRDYLEAVEHWRAAEALDEAALLLVNHYEELLTTFAADHLRRVVSAFQSAEVTPNTWAQLRLRAGQLAESSQDLPTALAEYGQVLSVAAEVALKAEACYRRARAFEAHNAEQALAHYEHCIRLVETQRPPPQWWLLSWVGIAWFHLNRHQQAEAHAALAQAETWGAQAALGPQARLHNAWGQWWYFERNLPQATAHYHRAWLAALEAHDLEAQLTSAQGLGILYAEQGQPHQSIGYLQQGLALARQLHNRRMEALFNKGLGQYYFALHEDAEATRYYQAALAIFQAMENRLGVAATSYDLAEVLVRQGQMVAAYHYFASAEQLGPALDMPEFLQACAALAQSYPVLRLPDENQRRILEWARAHKKFTREACDELLGLPKKQTLELLNALVDLALLERHGTGRGIYYHYPHSA